MNTVRLIISVTAVVLVFAAGTSEAQTTRYFTDAAEDKDWNNPDNWKTACSGGSASAVPSATDDVVICATKVAEVTDTTAVAKTVTVQGTTGTRIDIKPSFDSPATLTLGSGSGDLTSTPAGEGIQLLDAADSSNKATLAFVSANHTLAGNPGISGFDDLAEVTIASGKTLTCQSSKIAGHLKILGAGKFVSEGSTVQAIVSGGTLLVAPNELDDLILNDVRPTWYAYGGTLKFGSGISVVTGGSLTGHFQLGGSAELDLIIVDRSITTTGRLALLSGGRVIVNANLTCGSANNEAQITQGSIEVAADMTFIHY